MRVKKKIIIIKTEESEKGKSATPSISEVFVCDHTISLHRPCACHCGRMQMQQQQQRAMSTTDARGRTGRRFFLSLSLEALAHTHTHLYIHTFSRINVASIDLLTQIYINSTIRSVDIKVSKCYRTLNALAIVYATCI